MVAAPFSRSMRSLHADSPSWSLFGLIVAALLILAWAFWFFLAGLSLHETGKLSHVTSSGALVAEFPAETADRIRSGQSAALWLQGMNQGRSMPAIVTQVNTLHEPERLEVELYPKTRNAYVSLGRTFGQDGDDKIMGQVSIETVRVTPVALLMRTLAASRHSNSLSTPPAR